MAILGRRRSRDEAGESAHPTPARVFVSYRRDDSSGYAGRLYADLSERLGEDNVFIDINSLIPGADFVAAIEETLESCDMVIVVIGRSWLTITDSHGNRRLESENDFVCLEVGRALERSVAVIPLLVGGAVMPDPSELPERLVPLARRHAVEMSDRRWSADVEDLLAAIETARDHRARTSVLVGEHLPIVDANGLDTSFQAPQIPSISGGKGATRSHASFRGDSGSGLAQSVKAIYQNRWIWAILGVAIAASITVVWATSGPSRSPSRSSSRLPPVQAHSSGSSSGITSGSFTVSGGLSGTLTLGISGCITVSQPKDNPASYGFTFTNKLPGSALGGWVLVVDAPLHGGTATIPSKIYGVDFRPTTGFSKSEAGKYDWGAGIGVGEGSSGEFGTLSAIAGGGSGMIDVELFPIGSLSHDKIHVEGSWSGGCSPSD